MGVSLSQKKWEVVPDKQAASGHTLARCPVVEWEKF
jgi:hypothetical protein